MMNHKELRALIVYLHEEGEMSLEETIKHLNTLMEGCLSLLDEVERLQKTLDGSDNYRLFLKLEARLKIHGDYLLKSNHALSVTKSQLKATREALDWYGEKASAVKRYMTKPFQLNAVEAVLTELSIDDGRRAKEVYEDKD